MSIDLRDLIGGALLIIFGVAFSWYAAEHYQLGTLRQMGPGMFPTALGLLLAGFGAVLIVPALFRQGSTTHIRVRPVVFVTAGLAAYALAIDTLGLIPAIVGVIALSAFAETKVRLVSLVELCIGMSVLCWLIFTVVLGLRYPLFIWPF